ncbi:MAG: hypothetical protein HOV81_33470 [Kofleriaceae bacterium]|nr:hypothetical protein [Kofleriaceae bacterium]
MRFIAFVLVAACGAAPDKPLLANAPQPNTAAMAGGAAAAAAALTLADPDAASRRPEKKEDAEKKPVEIKESVPGDVLDRLDHAPAAAEPKAEPAAAKKPQGKPAKQPDLRLPARDALDFSQP